MEKQFQFRTGDKVKIKGIDHVFTLEENGHAVFPLKINAPFLGSATFIKFGQHCYASECVLELVERPEESKPRKLEAWECVKEGYSDKGEVRLCFSDSNCSESNHSNSRAYRKLSDEEMKELFSFLKD